MLHEAQYISPSVILSPKYSVCVQLQLRTQVPYIEYMKGNNNTKDEQVMNDIVDE